VRGEENFSLVSAPSVSDTGFNPNIYPVDIEEYDLSNRMSGTVMENTRITPVTSPEEVHDIVIKVDRDDINFHAGQSVGVLVPGPHPFGNPHYLRLYTIANEAVPPYRDKPLINLCVKRCFYVDEYSGERYKGIASNYLCDLQPGNPLTLTGPYGMPFEVPEDNSTNLLMIGLGTGIAPFRAFVKRIYDTRGGWYGKVRLFYGARSGLEMLYMNDEKNDFTQYYDKETFRAFEAISPRPYLDPDASGAALDQTLEVHADEVWKMILDPDTHVYVAGLESIREVLDKAFVKMAGSKERWERRKAEMVAGKRWIELIY
jgi:ferredoxin--NADP+ reductase